MLDLLVCATSVAAGGRIAGARLMLGLDLVEVGDDALAVLFGDVVGDALHPEDFDVGELAVFERVLDLLKFDFVDLVQVHGETFGMRSTLIL